jgi:hypothetical protein
MLRETGGPGCQSASANSNFNDRCWSFASAANLVGGYVWSNEHCNYLWMIECYP